jgi:hypothetical protein
LKEGSEGREGMAASAHLQLIKITVLGHEKAALWCNGGARLLLVVIHGFPGRGAYFFVGALNTYESSVLLRKISHFS